MRVREHAGAPTLARWQSLRSSFDDHDGPLAEGFHEEIGRSSFGRVVCESEHELSDPQGAGLQCGLGRGSLGRAHMA
jgi:hypothetical protein